jgi:hypothetical protein
MWKNTSWWAYHAADMDTPHQLAPSVGMSHVLYLSPSSGRLWWGHYPTSVKRRGSWLLIWHQKHLSHCETSFKEQNPLEAMWDNTLWWAYHVADMDTLHQLTLFVGTSHVLYPSPSSGGSDEAIIPYQLGDEGLGCLYGTKNTFLIARPF